MLERIFKLKSLGTNPRTEIIGGVTTFMTMAYIIFVNPAILSVTGMDFGAVMVATSIAASVATLTMAFSANYPIALAPGMGMNAYFAYTVCLIMGIPWQIALGCVFISGIIFLVLTVLRIRKLILHAIPEGIRNGTTSGIGLLIAFVGLKEGGIITSHPATFVKLGDLTNPAAQISLFGLLVTAIFLTKKIKGAILWGILATALMGITKGIVKYQGVVSMPPSIMPTFLKLDILGAMDLGLLTVIFVFLFVDIFDTVGTLVGVGQVGGFIKKGRLPRANRALFSDAVGTVVGSLAGTSTVTSYIESVAGIKEGAKSGLANVITGLLFLLAIFFFPLVKMIGGGYEMKEGLYLHPVTAPALIVVGSFMMHSISRIDWRDYSESIPAFLTLIIIPLTFSIADGLAIGFVSFAVIKLLTGKKQQVNWLVFILGLLFILRFLFLS